MLSEYMEKRNLRSIDEVREHIKYNSPQRPMELFDVLNESSYGADMSVEDIKKAAELNPTLKYYHNTKRYGDDWKLCFFDYCCLDGCGTRVMSQLSEKALEDCKAQGYIIDSDMQFQLYMSGDVHVGDSTDMEIIKSNFLKPAQEAFRYGKQYTRQLMLGKMMQECCGELYQILQSFDITTKALISCSNNNEREYLKQIYHLDNTEFAYKLSRVLIKVKEHVDRELVKSKEAQLVTTLASLGYPDKESVRRKLLCDINGISIDRDVLFDYLNVTDYDKTSFTKKKPDDVKKYLRTNGFEKTEDGIFTFCCLDVYNKTVFSKLSEAGQNRLIDNGISTDDDIRDALAVPRGFANDKLPVLNYCDSEIIEDELCRTDCVDLSMYPADVEQNMFVYLVKEMRRHNITLLRDMLTAEEDRAIYWKDLYADISVVHYNNNIPVSEIVDLRNSFVSRVRSKCNVILPEKKSTEEVSKVGFGFFDKEDMRQFLRCDIDGLPVSREELWKELNQSQLPMPETFKELYDFTDMDKAFDTYADVNNVYKNGRVKDAVFTYCCLDNRNRTLIAKLSQSAQDFLKSKDIVIDDQIRAQLLQSTNLYASIRISMEDRDIIKKELNKIYIDLLYYDQHLTRDMDEKCFIPLIKEMSRNNVDALRNAWSDVVDKAVHPTNLDASIEDVAKKNGVSIDCVVAVRKKFVQTIVDSKLVLVDENEYDSVTERVVAAHSLREGANKLRRKAYGY